MKPFLCKFFVWAATAWMLSGCSLYELHKDLDRQDRYGTVSGTVQSDSSHHKPIQVLLVKVNMEDVHDNTIVNSTVMFKPGPFQFFALPGTYMVGAFEDKNEDMIFQPDEYVGWHGAPDPIVVKPDKKYGGLLVNLRSSEQAKLQFPLLYELPPFLMSKDLMEKFRMGEVVKLSDPRFAAKNGGMGFWEPLKFMEEVGGGIFFLQEYEPEKIPILIVHGAGGNPVEFKHIIEGLNRDKFQPWVLFYPSGMRLGIVSRWVTATISILLVEHKFERLYILAHSMGGLVARDVINRMVREGGGKVLQLFVSMSTPWDGHVFAAKGVKQCPVVIPAWYDMVPGSPFIRNLFKTPLPSHLEYNLFFSYRGGFHWTLPPSNDGTVSLQSELFLPVELSAKRVLGFDVTHGGILSSPDVIERLNILLEERRRIE